MILMNLINLMRSKLNKDKGESLAEVLIAVLIIAVGLVLLSSLVIASSRLVDKSQTRMSSVYNAVNTLEESSVNPDAASEIDIVSESMGASDMMIVSNVKIYKANVDSDTSIVSYSK